MITEIKLLPPAQVVETPAASILVSSPFAAEMTVKLKRSMDAVKQISYWANQPGVGYVFRTNEDGSKPQVPATIQAAEAAKSIAFGIYTDLVASGHKQLALDIANQAVPQEGTNVPDVFTQSGVIFGGEEL